MSRGRIAACCYSCSWLGDSRRTNAAAEIDAQRHESENPGHECGVIPWPFPRPSEG